MTFIRTPFGTDGDLLEIPNDVQPDGRVSMEEGYGFDYSREPGTTDAKDVERDKQNWLFNLISKEVRKYQTQSYADFITSGDNGGTPFPYAFKAYVRYDDGTGYDIYYSLVDANTSLPTDTTKWARVQYGAFVPGMGMEHHDINLPVGWVWQNSLTIGNAASGATGRADADTSALFAVLWNSYPNSVLALQNSAGAPVARGISAAADYAANRRIPTPDKRGRSGVGKDDMGGAPAANRITSGASGIAGSTMGANGGVEAVTLATPNIPSHSHTFSATTSVDGTHNHTIGEGGSSGIGPYVEGGNGPVTGQLPTSSNGAHSHTVSGTTSTTGGGTAHQNVQPSIICNYIIKL